MFEKDDVVILKSGGPYMLVRYVCERTQTVRVNWRNGTFIQEQYFSFASVKRVKCAPFKLTVPYSEVTWQGGYHRG